MRDPSALRGYGLLGIGRGRESSFAHLDRGLEDALFVDPIFRSEQRLGSVFDKAVGNAKCLDWIVIFMFVFEIRHHFTKPANY